ncbi:MAG: gamma-glutamylcyclotransferase family protein [Thiolinea sp.]
MLRILFWKLGFEWANLLRILNPRDEQRIYYFAFGANLSPEILRQRRITVFDAFDYVLEDAALRFSQSGFYRDHGYASADPAPGEQVYGKMYLIRNRDARRMDYYEGVPFLHSHLKVVQQYRESAFYYYRARLPAADLKPTQEYLDYLTVAYRDMAGVPEAYIAAMEATEVLDYFEPQTLTGKFVCLERWPAFLHPLLIRYESICRSLVRLMWNSSMLTWMIKM